MITLYDVHYMIVLSLKFSLICEKIVLILVDINITLWWKKEICLFVLNCCLMP